jgi:hypothetical protein
MSLRKTDTEKEEAIAKYLDQYFYSKPCIKDYSRKIDRTTQLEGIDVTFTINHPNLSTDTLYVDEKSAAHYVNKNIPTFAFELQFQNSRNIKTKGWLYDENKKTTHYLIIWVKTNRSDSNFSFIDLSELEVMLIDRMSIKQILNDKKFNIENLDDYISEMLKDCKNPNEKNSKEFGAFKLHYSGHLSEKSINVTLKKMDMKEKCIGHFKVTSAGVKKV